MIRKPIQLLATLGAMIGIGGRAAAPFYEVSRPGSDLPVLPTIGTGRRGGRGGGRRRSRGETDPRKAAQMLRAHRDRLGMRRGGKLVGPVVGAVHRAVRKMELEKAS